MFLQFNCSFPVFWGASFLGVLLGGSPSRGLFLEGASFWGLPTSWGVLQFSFWGVYFRRGFPLGVSLGGFFFGGLLLGECLLGASFLGASFQGVSFWGVGVPPSRGSPSGGLLAKGSPCLGVSPC